MGAVEAAAASRGVQATAFPLRDTPEIEPVISSFAREPNGGLILLTDAFIRLRQKPIAELAEKYRLPAISWDPAFPRLGGLMG